MTPNLPDFTVDPTLEALDRIMEAEEAATPLRTYLGASSLGDQCERRQYYSLHHAPASPWPASTIYKFHDGHRVEALMIERLRKVPGIELWDRDLHNPAEQIGGSLFNGRFGWHCDGVIRGLYQAPKTSHVFECKAVNPEKFKKFMALRRNDEKSALMNWDYTYFCQQQLYMGLLDLSRAYMVVTTPGGREMGSCRTNFVPVHFEALMKKAERILEAKEPPVRIHEDPSYWQCKYCRFRDHCHQL